MAESRADPEPREPAASEEVLTEAMLRALIEQIPLTTYIDRLDAISSNVYTSPQLEATLGYTLQEWVEDEELFTKIVHPDDRDTVLAEHERTRDTGEPFSMEYRMIAKDGTVHWFLDEANVIPDEHGNPQYHHGCLLEITERKELEQLLRESEERLRTQKAELESLLEISPTGIVSVDREGRVTTWNLAAEELFGYACEDAVGRPLRELVTSATDQPAEESAAAGRVRLIGRRCGRAGAGVDVEVIAVPLRAGSAAGRLVLYHDVGELQRARQSAEEATRAKSAFLATMSHEIRTPMNAVIGMTELLLDTELDPEQRGFADVVRTSGEALLAIINDILDFSKIEAGKLDLERTPFALSDCVESALDLVANRAAEKNLDIACLIDPEVPESVIGDPTRLRQILVNLLSNAVKFTERGEVVLEVAVAADSGQLSLAVRDTGIGIPADRLGRLFQSFSQVDASTTRRYGGTGLGLTISKRLSELMGGTITVTSEPGRGSRFEVTIDAPAAAALSRVSEADIDLEGRRVLIVDDNATNREVVRRHVTGWKMLPRDTGAPEEALEWIRRGDPFDLAVLDMQMPGMDGLELARAIRGQRDATQLPLMMLTSLGRRKEDLEADIDFAAYLTKPIKSSQLHDALVGIFARELAAPSPASAPRAPAVERSALRVLLAEDNAVNQRIALLVLGKLGYEADVVGNGQEALEALRRGRYDVVLMDVEMPEMDGLEASRRIHAEWQGRERPRIVAMTANAMEGDRETCLAAGMDDYVSKPIRREVLAAALERCAPASTPEAGAAAGYGTVLDSAALTQLRETAGDEEIVVELIDAFLAEVPDFVAGLRAADERGEASVVRRLAHTLKSNARTFGATTLAERCDELELLAREGRLDTEAVGLISAIAEELEGVVRALRSVGAQA